MSVHTGRITIVVDGKELDSVPVVLRDAGNRCECQDAPYDLITWLEEHVTPRYIGTTLAYDLVHELAIQHLRGHSPKVELFAHTLHGFWKQA